MRETTTHQKTPELTLAYLAGSEAMVEQMDRARQYLTGHTDSELLNQIGIQVPGIDAGGLIDKTTFQSSFGGGTTDVMDDFLAGRGLFYISEKGRLYLDCTAGHYQVTWGYHHPVLTESLRQGLDRGIISDNHSNIPQWPVKRLAQKLVQAADGRLDTVLVGLATGSVACESALKIMLKQHERLAKPGPALVVALTGNYHGTGIAMQTLRNMWPGMIRQFEVLTVEPNDTAQLEAAFKAHGQRIAGFWAEPIMMNREAIAVESDYLQRARELTEEVEALMVFDEIQTGFWTPHVFMYKCFDITPDIVVVGKGMCTGFHPLSAILYRRPLDMLAQYDAISTNGNAALASLVALANLELIEGHAEEIERVQAYLFAKLQNLAEAHPHLIAALHGCPAMAGLKFHAREKALVFHQRCVENGLWLRAHAYHEGHSTVLMKFALCLSTDVVDAFVKRLQNLLAQT